MKWLCPDCTNGPRLDLPLLEHEEAWFPASLFHNPVHAAVQLHQIRFSDINRIRRFHDFAEMQPSRWPSPIPMPLSLLAASAGATQCVFRDMRYSSSHESTCLLCKLRRALAWSVAAQWYENCGRSWRGTERIAGALCLLPCEALLWQALARAETAAALLRAAVTVASGAQHERSNKKAGMRSSQPGNTEDGKARPSQHHSSESRSFAREQQSQSTPRFVGSWPALHTDAPSRKPPSNQPAARC